ncbi:hypothetical protein [Anaerotruncus colihominis]|uniref:hypothetical protein n=1 Tax=Anaerotruncus colihominis TaxID=169435 RepID=UPI002942E0D0|nr:hypothetical protein [Anaerotruncus colihominis]
MDDRMGKIREHMRASLKMSELLEMAGLHKSTWDSKTNKCAIFKGESINARCIGHMDATTLEITWRTELDYLYIRAFCKLPHWYYYDTESEIRKARADGAPKTSLIKDFNGTWLTFEDIASDDMKVSILAAISEMI